MANRRKAAPALQNESIIPPTLERAAQAHAAGLEIEVAEPERTARGVARRFYPAKRKTCRSRRKHPPGPPTRASTMQMKGWVTCTCLNSSMAKST